GLDGFTTDYGVLLLVKIVGFLALGVAGYLHRERTIPALAPADGNARPGVFWRLVGVEVVLISAVMGVAVAMADTGPPVPQEPQEGLSPAAELSQYPVPPAPTLATWFTQWRAELLFGSVAVLLAVIYLRWVLRLRRRGDAWPISRTITWLIGALGFAYVTCSGPAVYGRLMFSAH